MAGASHDVLVQVLRDDPSLLPELLRISGRELPGKLEPMDSAVRFTRPVEVRPDVVGHIGDTWVACEVQNDPDDAKGRRWLLGMAAMHDETRRMGELVVITASKRVARWARRIAHVTGPIGTSLKLSPLILLLGPRVIPQLLDPAKPELALCAAWAMQRRHGWQAERIVLRAVEVTDTLPQRLRNAQLHAILSVLSDKLRARLERKMINPDKIHEKPAARRFRLLLEKQGRESGREEGRQEGRREGRQEGRQEGRKEGEVLGRAASLLLVLEQRGLAVTDAQRARIRECTDAAQLDAWLLGALTATSVDDLLKAAAGERSPTTSGKSSRAPARARPANGAARPRNKPARAGRAKS
jgi:hypothetical protein